MNNSIDVLIVGSGIAGLRAALEASKYSDNVKIISKLPVMRSHSVSAAGGINSVSIPSDSLHSYFSDTIKGSDFLADQDAVHILVNRANDEIKYLEEIGVDFDKFDRSTTRNIAKEIELFNRQLGKENPYILLGPGRWGTADPWLGVPVQWNQISNAKVIVEVCMEGLDIDPSFGSHFFQMMDQLGMNPFHIQQ